MSADKLLELLPEALRPSYAPLVRESDPTVHDIVKAADKLSAHIKMSLIHIFAEFALASAKKVGIIFSGGVYVGENTAQLANVRRVRPSCAAASRSPFKREPSETGLV